jgi:outer membrane protein
MSKKITFLISVLLTISLQAQNDSVKSFTLDQAIQYSLSNHANAKNADLDITKGKHFVTEQIALGLPQINGNIDYMYYIKPGVIVLPGAFFGPPVDPNSFVAIPATPLNTMNMSITAAMPIVNGQYFIGIEAAKSYKNLLAEQKTKTIQGVKEEVIKAYYLALIALESKKVVDSTLKVLDETVRQTEEIYKEGLIEELDVKQLRLTQSNIKNLSIQLESNIQLTLYSLKFRMAYPIESEITLTERLEPLIASNNFESLIGGLQDSVDVKANIDYRLIDQKIKLDNYQLKLQRASAYPTLSTFFSVGGNFINNQRWIFLNGTQSNLNGVVWGFNLKVPIFSSWNRVSKLKQLKIEVEKDKNNQVMVEEGLKLSYLSSKISVQNNYLKLKTAKENYDLAGEIRRVNTIKYNEGLISSLNLSQAESQYFDAQQKYFQTIYDLLLSKIALDKSMNQF